jgi:hypothetical protein
MAAIPISFAAAVLLLTFACLVPCVRLLAFWRRRRGALAFFHPYCNDGGGGERVLWCAIVALQRAYPDIDVFVFTGDKPEGAEILQKARDRFGIALPRPVTFVRLRFRRLLDPKTYPRFTMLGQAVGGALVATEALCRLTPVIFVDSMGCACAYPVASALFGCRVACYVHYPIISSEMISAVGEGRAGHNNDPSIANSTWRTMAKLWYYRAFALLYASSGRFAEVVLVNSTWTAGHIRAIWRAPRARVLFPPCDTASLEAIRLAPDSREQLVISIAQFRCGTGALIVEPSPNDTALLAMTRLPAPAPTRPRSRIHLLSLACSDARGRNAGLRRRTRYSYTHSPVSGNAGQSITRTHVSLCWAPAGMRATRNESPSCAGCRHRLGLGRACRSEPTSHTPSGSAGCDVRRVGFTPCGWSTLASVWSSSWLLASSRLLIARAVRSQTLSCRSTASLAAV